MHAKPKRVDRPTLLRLAAEADVDPRSIAKRLRLERPLKGRVGERVDQVLAAHGLLVTEPESEATGA